jgi:2-dehydropantoate 2-reductase
MTNPGVIQHSETIQRILFGEYTGEPSKRVQRILRVLRHAEIDADISDSIERLIWRNFVLLVGLSGTTNPYASPHWLHP